MELKKNIKLDEIGFEQWNLQPNDEKRWTLCDDCVAAFHGYMAECKRKMKEQQDEYMDNFFNKEIT